ncbi:MarR family transcriptional regulator [Nocardia sp. 852002-20019_SCH5090214]|uniref:MarR family winged helix-turn-helix transcriptional regulator n=1 Tax=Nocardia TaxID=1817 RepID=UPI0004C41BBD|nr:MULTISPECIES: MarR family transcriptional regulator [Nocardia]OBA54018.1 MarR family transcriptional regulator [Nocardia sp. 852002-51101_SCH5132738]OBA63011.1 MarR family transcriptional regulator [Nocardia sp. 852002-20019_SCH5090214]OBB35081.1 MarR family transcriptional regulator [Nocardia sp. 852002-51244_SCH5132740]OBF82318.1 MarR family transcriptional regulator [Mycobacterium sp. 852002-51759_SCH5129042]
MSDDELTVAAEPTPDEVWRVLTDVVKDTRDTWKRAVVDRMGMPFSRFRVLRRLLPGPLPLKELARVATMDAPATTVVVNDLEARGLVSRETAPDDRRRKLVTITDAGREVIAQAMATPDPPPPTLTALSAEQLRTLHDLLRLL